MMPTDALAATESPAQPVAALPSPQARPDAAVLIYDGHCKICQAQMQRLARWDKAQRIAYLSLHDPLVAQRYPDLTHDELMRNMVLVDRQGIRHVGAAAVRYLSRLLPRLWWLAPLLHIPFSLPLWQWGYQQVARRRYRWNNSPVCDGDSCGVHFR